MDVAVVYHWWTNQPVRTYNNLSTPIVCSIATLRGVNANIPIYVMDLTDLPHDWGNFPELLNFKVLPTEPSFRRYKDKVKGWRHLSRIHDLVHQMPKFAPKADRIIYCDSDIFWIQDPLPLHCTEPKFCFDGWNSGFFYYSPSNIDEFFDVYDSYTRAAIHSPQFTEILKSKLGYKDLWMGVWDEMTLSYMSHVNKDLISFIPKVEHSTSGDIVSNYVDLKILKMFHSNNTMVKNDVPKIPEEKDHSRGLLCLLIEEFYRNMTKSLSNEDIRKIFTEIELRTYLPRQFSLLRESHRLKHAKEKGVFYIHKCFPGYWI